MSSTRPSRRRRPATLVALIAGLVSVLGAGTALAGPPSSPAADAFRSQPLVAGTPCTVTAKACVDLDSKRSWLFKDGKVVRGPVPVATGGQGKVTPVGHSLRVYRKSKDHKSQEYREPDGSPAAMPYAVFFQDGGIAFHEGNVHSSSGGCVRLLKPDAIAWFDYLQIGDQVQVVSAEQVKADRAKG